MRSARPSWSPVAERVTTTPAAVEISRAGICETSASPTDRIEKVSAALASVMPLARPIISPPIRLMAVIRSPAIGVALDELARAVHRAEKVGFALQRCAGGRGHYPR